MPERRLRADVIPAAELSEELTDNLYALYESCYDGADPARFRADMVEKQWIIVLCDTETTRLAGFSTQMLLQVEVDEHPIDALFSGDTIIHPDYWGSQELVHAWCRFAGKLKSRLGDRPLFWFLISKGYRTYLYLPCFFREFYPRRDYFTPPFEAKLIRALGGTKYPDDFNPETGIIEHLGAHDRLKTALDATAKRRRNPHVAYFLQRNPGYWKGEELVCVAEISVANMRSIAKREMEAALRISEGPVAHP